MSLAGIESVDCEGEMTYFCIVVQRGRLSYSAKCLSLSMVPERRV